MAAILSISCPPGEGYVPSSDFHFAPLRRLTLEVQIDTVPQEPNLARVADRLAEHGQRLPYPQNLHSVLARKAWDEGVV
jgi:hypothetical protein